MKDSQLLILATVLGATCLGAGSVDAQDLFRAQVTAISVTTNDTGGLAYSRYGNHQIIAEAAASAGLTNLSGLRLVYNKAADNLQVVSGTNHTVIATPITFNGGVSLSKTNETVRERLAWVFVGTNTAAGGTLRATERSRFGTSNELTGFSLIGELQFALPTEGTNEAVIVSGNISAGAKLRPIIGKGRDHDEDED
jgi:hypothetical protein